MLLHDALLDQALDPPQGSRLAHKTAALFEAGKEVLIVSDEVSEKVFVLINLKHLEAAPNGSPIRAREFLVFESRRRAVNSPSWNAA